MANFDNSGYHYSLGLARYMFCTEILRTYIQNIENSTILNLIRKFLELFFTKGMENS
jgi:hypothetical protein